MKRLLFICPLLFLTLSIGFSQVPEDKAGLLKGEGMGLGKFAESKGYPGPKHVLDLSEKLQLTDAQKKGLQTIYDEMKARAAELGKLIIEAEEELNTSFVEGLVTEKSVRENAEQIGRLRGKLRAVHLNAHIKTKQLLTEKQVEMYKKLRSSEGEQKEEKKN